MLLHTPELREKEYAAGNLDTEVMYWQLVSVREYFSPEEAKDRASQWERRFNISRFIYETPFTKDQDSDQTESVEHQWKRKQVFFFFFFFFFFGYFFSFFCSPKL